MIRADLWRRAVLGLAAVLIACASPEGPKNVSVGVDPLPSWNDGAARSAIMEFVSDVTTAGGRDFVPEPERVAVFDNDGTLWSEQPVYFQLAFALDQVKALAPEHPEWRDEQPFKAVLEGDTASLAAGGLHALLELVAASHSGMTTDEFAGAVEGWLTSARHPRFDRPYTDLVFQPMLELLAYLRANGFTTYIVSGGGIEFMRVFAQRAYGIPPEQVVGSMWELAYAVRDGVPVLVKGPGIYVVDDGPGKPVAIERAIGRRPIAAFGNSDGDFQMLEWTTAGPGRRFGLLVHHDDAEREWAYDRESSVGRLSRGLDEASARGWTVVSMQHDWKRIYPFATEQQASAD